YGNDCAKLSVLSRRVAMEFSVCYHQYLIY
ncbi:MAG: hypothetical protein ACI9XP_001204, partial [Lentimonas sp.]